jgi:hypothetical protein
MAEKPHHESRFMHGLRAVGQTIRKSPQVMRKGITNLKKKMGGSKQYSSLEDCQDNGWLHTDEQIAIGVSYKLKYLGSMEIGFVPGDAHKNNAMAIDTMRKVKSMKIQHDNLTLVVAAERMTLKRPNNDIVMRHSTCRVAYSTVDHEHPNLFCYVALPRKSKIALCHVFHTKSAKMSYEMTFTCAQAFDANFRRWQKDQKAAKHDAEQADRTDIDPENAVPSPNLRRKMVAAQEAKAASAAAAAAAAETSSAKPPAAESAAPAAAAAAPAAGGGGDDYDDGYIQIGGLEIEDEDEIAAAADEMFGNMAQNHEEPSLLEIGVEPEHYNDAESEEDEESHEAQ